MKRGTLAVSVRQRTLSIPRVDFFRHDDPSALPISLRILESRHLSRIDRGDEWIHGDATLFTAAAVLLSSRYRYISFASLILCPLPTWESNRTHTARASLSLRSSSASPAVRSPLERITRSLPHDLYDDATNCLLPYKYIYILCSYIVDFQVATNQPL